MNQSAAKDKLEGKVKAPKANIEGWIRHRGGKCPAAIGEKVEVRYRSGYFGFHTASLDDEGGQTWDHLGHADDIMAWRPNVATTEQSLEVEQWPAVKECLTVEQANERAFDACVEKCAADDIEMQAAKYFDGPIQWRDRIHAIDAEQKTADEAHKAATDARTAERAELVQKLAGEGLALIAKVDADDMSDPRNWKRGDVVECVSDYSNQFTRGKFYTLRSDYREEEYSVKISKDDTGDTFNGWTPENFKWNIRPTA